MASYFFTDVFPSSFRILSTSLTRPSPSLSASSSATVALSRLSSSSPEFSSTHPFSCATLFGLSSPVRAFAFSDSSSLILPCICSAPATSSMSTLTPAMLMCWSRIQYWRSCSGTGCPASLRYISISVTTSWRQ